jgi:hypothetical protein
LHSGVQGGHQAHVVGPKGMKGGRRGCPGWSIRVRSELLECTVTHIFKSRSSPKQSQPKSDKCIRNWAD